MWLFNHWLQLKLGTSQLESFCVEKDSPKNKASNILLGQLLFPNYFTIVSLLLISLFPNYSPVVSQLFPDYLPISLLCPFFFMISLLFPYYSLIIFLLFHLYFPITISQWCPYYFLIISRLFPNCKIISQLFLLYAYMPLWFPCYFPIISAWFPCVPNYSLIISILFLYYCLNCFPTMSLLFHSYVPIMFLLLHHYFPNISPVFPYYVCMVSLFFPYCFPFSSQSFLYYCPNYFFLFPCYIPIIILLFNSFCFGLRIYLFLRFLLYPDKFVHIAYYALCFPLVNWIC